MTTEAVEPELVTLADTTTAVVEGIVPTAELAAFFDRSFGRLAEVMASQGVAPTGPAFALYHGPPGDRAHLEVGFPTATAIRPDDPVTASSLPGGRVARMVHAGSFDGLGDAWERLRSWATDQGLSLGPVLWEVYLTEPSPDMDPADLRTELNWPVSG